MTKVFFADGGMLYLEVPAPEIPCRHESNPNPYSVLPVGLDFPSTSLGLVIRDEGRFSFKHQ